MSLADTNISTNINYNSEDNLVKQVTESSIINSNINTTNSTDKNIKTATITKNSTQISINNKTAYSGENIQLIATVVDSNNGKYISGGTVVFKINGKTVGYGDLNNGKAYYTYNTSGLTSKNYTIYVKYPGNSNYEFSETTELLTILKYNTVVSASNKTVTYNDKIVLVATAVNKQTGNYITSGKVAFKINGKTVGHSTLVNGKAYYTYNTSGLSVKIYNITAVLGSSSNYNGNTSKVGYLNVTPIETKMTVSNKTIWKSEYVQLVATVVDKNTSKYINSGTVVFKINGKTVGYSKVENGKAYFDYDSTSLQAKTYNITAKYSGDIYAESNSTGYLKVEALSFTYSQIKEAAVYLRNHYESNQIITTIPIGSTSIDVYSFLPIMIHMIKNLNSGKSSQNVEYIYYYGISSQKDSLKAQTFTLSQMISIGSKVLNHYQVYSTAPENITINSQNFGFYNLAYSFSKMLDVSTSTYLPGSCKVYNWNTIHPTDSTKRTIYISTDNIYNTAKDTAFMNEIKKILESKGYTVYIIGIGPNTHNTKIWAESLPDNAVQLSIFGGADAGVINDVCTRSFMRKKANRLVFFAYYAATSKDITNLSWLERAHDDNYSPSSFTGIANPDKYLQSKGYDYVYTSSASEIANALIKYIS